jgi:hypothetical protein
MIPHAQRCSCVQSASFWVICEASDSTEIQRSTPSQIKASYLDSFGSSLTFNRVLHEHLIIAMMVFDAFLP